MQNKMELARMPNIKAFVDNLSLEQVKQLHKILLYGPEERILTSELQGKIRREAESDFNPSISGQSSSDASLPSNPSPSPNVSP